jgi:hypothetical protein
VRSKRSQAITLDQARRWTEGVTYASRKGRPLNRYVVIAWDCAPSDVSANARFIRLTELLRKWLQQRYGHALFAYVWERPPGCLLHVNLLVHVEPADVSTFDQMVRKWVLRDAHDVRRGSVCCRRVWGLDDLVRYLLKGGDDVVRGAFQIPLRFPPDQGEISFKRLGLARSLDAAARRLDPERPPLNPAPRRPLAPWKAQLFSRCSVRALVAGMRVAV